MAGFWESIQKGLGPGLRRAYGPITGPLEQGTKAVFGPNATFFPKSWGVSTMSDAGGLASGQTLTGNPLADVFADEGMGQSTNLPPKPPESRVGDPGLTSVLDWNRVSSDMKAAQEGDPAAKARVQAMASSPAVTELGSPKAKSKPKADLGFKFDQGTGFSSSMGSVMPDLNEEVPQTLPAPRPIESRGGGGVEVPEQEQQPFNRAQGLGIVGDTLINLGNAIGNGRPMATGGWLEQRMDQMRQEQMEQLKQRHDMWTDTYKQSQQLPGEVLTDPRFSSLAQAKAALDKDMLDQKIDNEKNVSNFLTELKRHEPLLRQLGISTQVDTQMAGVTATANARAELEKRVAAGDPQAILTKSLLPVTPGQEWEEKVAARKADDARLAQQAEWMHNDRLTAIDDRKATQGLYAQQRGDALDLRRKQSAAAGLNAMMKETLRMYGKPDEDGNITNPEEAVNNMFRIHGDDIVAAAEQIGIRVQKAGDASNPLLVINGRPMNARQGQSYLLAQIRMAGGE